MMEKAANTLGILRWPSEWHFQASIFKEASWRALVQEEYALLFAIPNGQVRPGQRAEAGIKKGIPDIFLSVARRGYHGLYIELKCGRNKLSEEQRETQRLLRDQGYRVETITDSQEEFFSVCECYLHGEDEE